MTFLRAPLRENVPQSEPLDARQVRNDAGGYVYEVSRMEMLDRFLICGTASGTYYVNEKTLTARNTANIEALLADTQSALAAVDRAVQVSVDGLAVKQDYALYVIALAACSRDQMVRLAAYDAILKVCRTASTLFQFLSYLKGRRGWSRGLRRAVAQWYESRSTDSLGYQMVKYQQRHGFTHRDVLRLAHPNGGRNPLFAWAVGKPYGSSAELPNVVNAYETVKALAEPNAAYATLLPREALPTEWLNDPAVWRTLLDGMPLTALLRNLGNLTKVGVLKAHTREAEDVCVRLTDPQALAAARVHPIAVLLALKTYAAGRGFKGSGSWAPVGSVIDALNTAFGMAFKSVQPTGKRLLVALDVSASMGGQQVAGISNLSAMEVACAMALCHQAEPSVEYVTFDMQWKPLRISGDETPERLLRRLSAIRGGGTDTAQAVVAAQSYLEPFDAIVVYTDNETWSGYHGGPMLKRYRKERNRDARLIVASATATATTMAETDPLTLNVCGFDASVPTVIGAFLR